MKDPSVCHEADFSQNRNFQTTFGPRNITLQVQKENNYDADKKRDKFRVCFVKHVHGNFVCPAVN